MSNQTLPSSPSKITDPYKHLPFVFNPNNNTLTRLFHGPYISPSSNPNLPISILSKDLTINPSNKTWVRLFLPKNALNNNPPKKLPLILFFHGSGFVVHSASCTKYHNFCVQMAETVDAVVASVEYRLAPEHRLPAAYDDAMEALKFIKTSQDEWLTKYADYSNFYLMGNSAGATIAYHAGLRVLGEMDDYEPLKIQGLILRQPFFGGTKRSESELKFDNDPLIPLCVIDLMWDLSLPIGVDCDHEYSNLMAGNGVEVFDKIKEVGWRVLISGNGKDPLVDREKELAKLMEENGVKVVKDFQEHGYHTVEYIVPSEGEKFIALVKAFISSSSG